MKILFLSRWFPYPADNGSKLRILNLLKGLGRKHEVTLLSFASGPGEDASAPELTESCAEIIKVPWREFDPHSAKAKRGFLSLKPRSIIDTYSSEMARRIEGLLARESFDLVIASQLPMAAYYPHFRGTPALFEELELGLAAEAAGHEADWKRGFRRSLTWLKLRAYLGRLLSRFAGVTVVSEQERGLLRRHFPAVSRVHVTPNCIDLEAYEGLRPEPACNRLIFTGSFRYQANYEAMCWFVGDVFPRILERMPDVELVITGDHCSLPLPSERNILRVGHVNDVAGLIASSTVAVAPLLSGGGTRLKILEAMACGTPVAATSKGAEGLEARHEEHLLIADDPAGFAACVVRLLEDETLRRDLVARGKQLVSERYDWSRVLPEFERFSESLAAVRGA